MEPDSNPPESKTAENATTPIDYKRLPDDQFFELYANNVVFQPTAWDMKLVFGQIDQSKGANAVVQEVAITLPWSQIKVGIYLLQVNLALHEIVNGKVYAPKGVITPPVPPTEDQENTFPAARKVFDQLQEIFRQFRESNPEAF
jgi:hypothetical protein